MVRSARRNRAVANAEKAAKDDASLKKAAKVATAGLMLHPLTIRTLIKCLLPASSAQHVPRLPMPRAPQMVAIVARLIVTARSRLVPSLAGPPRLLVTEMIAQND